MFGRLVIFDRQLVFRRGEHEFDVVRACNLEGDYRRYEDCDGTWMITDPISARVEQLLTESAQVFVPFEEIYDTLQREGLLAHFDATALLEFLKGNWHFQVLGGFSHLAFLDAETAIGLELLSAMTGPWVVLRVRLASPLATMGELLRHLQHMNHAIENAWRQLDKTPEAQDDLLGLLMLSDALERKVRLALTEALELGANKMP